jgi:hypothetical protein
VTGRVTAPGAIELSGLVLSTTRRGVLWSVNDSGNSPTLFGLTASGASAGEVAVAGAQNTDWEDIAREAATARCSSATSATTSASAPRSTC